MFNVDQKDLDAQRKRDETEYKKLVPGGYVCQVTSVNYDGQKNSLRVEFEIVEGEFKGYAADFRESTGKDFSPISDMFFGTEKAKWKIHRFLNAVCDTNAGFVWNGDEKKLLKKGVGIVMAEMESSTGKTYVGPYSYTTAKNIRENNFKVPDKKIEYKGAKVVASAVDVFPSDDEEVDDLPF